MGSAMAATALPETGPANERTTAPSQRGSPEGMDSLKGSVPQNLQVTVSFAATAGRSSLGGRARELDLISNLVPIGAPRNARLRPGLPSLEEMQITSLRGAPVHEGVISRCHLLASC